MFILSGRGARHGQRVPRCDDIFSSSAGHRHQRHQQRRTGHLADFGGTDMTRTYSILMATTAVLAAGTAAAQETPFDLGTLLLSPSLSPTDANRTGATVEVIDGTDTATGADSVSVLNRLTRLPGVNYTQNGPLGSTGNIQVRGLSGTYVGTRIDGIDVSDPSSTQVSFDYGNLIPTGIERVELLKGSQSALYGSEAIGGVVNLSTWRPTELGYANQAQLEVGSYDTYATSVSVGQMTDRGFVAFTLGQVQSDGFSSLSYNDEADGFDQTTLNFSVEYDINDVFTIGATVLHRDGTSEFDNSSFSGNVEASSAQEETGYRIYLQAQTGLVAHELSYSAFDTSRDIDSDFPTTFDGERRTFAYLGSADLNSALTVNAGLEYTEESFDVSGVAAEEDNASAMVELLYSPTDQIDVSLALRHDDNSDFGGETTGRLAAAWRPVEDLTFRAVVGTGYRAPSLYERFSDSGVATLAPETSRSVELGVEKGFGDRGFVKATLFRTEIDDLIDYVSGGTGCASAFGCYNQVAGTTTSEGVELSGAFDVTETYQVYGSYTYVDATQADGSRSVRTPKHDLVLGVAAAFAGGLSGYVDVTKVADVEPSPFAPTDNLVGDYTLIGMGLTYDLSDSAEVYTRIENVTDEAYETAGGYNQPGRSIYVGVRAAF